MSAVVFSLGSVPVLLPLDEVAGGGVDLELVLGAALPELALVDGPAVVKLELDLDEGGVGGPVLGQLGGLLLGDVVAALVAGGGGVVLRVEVVAQHGAGGGVDLVVVLLIAAVELHVIHPAAVVPVQLGQDEGDLVAGQAGVREGDLLGPALADETFGAAAGGGDHIVLDVEVIAPDGTGLGVDLIVVLGVAAVELHLVHRAAVLPVQVGAEEGGLRGGEAGVLEGDLLGLGLADVAGGGGLSALVGDHHGLGGRVPGDLDP